jgi:OOP family OmpA-OmpF porin
MTFIMQTLQKIILFSVGFFIMISGYANTLAPEQHPPTFLTSDQSAPLIDSLQAEGATVQMTDRLIVILRVDDLFQFPSSTRLVDVSRRGMLIRVALLAKSYGNRLITVSGHTDNVGTDTYKLRQSYKQASTVAAYLWSRGIPLKNLLVVGCGDTEPVASNKTAEGSAANRRIEIEIQ